MRFPGGEPSVAPLRAWDPREISGYRLQGRLGSGGMGTVYLSTSRGGRPVALKVVHPEIADDTRFRRRFEQEVRAARRVRGRYIAPVVDSNTEGPVPWLAIEYVAGPALSKALQDGPLAWPVALRLVAGVASALTTIHAERVVHRDLKPGNVVLSADGPVVIDFGIARASDATALTGTRTQLGTPGFMAPEQVAGAEVTWATDVFALGLTAHLAATGQHPFGEAPPAVLLYRIAHEEPDLAPCPGELRPLVARCLSRAAAQRPSAEEVLALCRETAARWGLADPLPAAGWLTPPAVPADGGGGARAAAGARAGEADEADEAGGADAPTVNTARRAEPGWSARPVSAFRPPVPPAPPVTSPPPYEATATRGRSRRVWLLTAASAAVLAVAGALLVQNLTGDEGGDDGGWREDRPASGENVNGDDAANGQALQGQNGGANDQTLTIGVEFDQPGLGLAGAGGEPVGFGIDVATYVAERLGYQQDQIRWVSAPAADRVTMLESGKADLVVADFAITDERGEAVDFAGPYLVTHQDLLVRADEVVTSEDDINDMTVCAVSGSAAAQSVLAVAPGATLETLDSFPECLAALETGAVDAMTTDDVILAGYAAQEEHRAKVRLAGLRLSGDLPFGVGVGNSGLRDDVSQALRDLVDDGSWQAYLEAHLGPAAGYDHGPPPEITY